MNAPIIAFFNNKGGVGKTSLVYHLAWMCSDLDKRVLAVDLDPQANLTAAFLDEDRLEALWPDGDHEATIFGAIQPLLRGIGDIAAIDPVKVEQDALFFDQLALLPGDLALSRFEDQLSENWPNALDGDERAFRVLSAFWRLIRAAARKHEAEVVLLDLGPNLGAMNRAALIASDAVVVPLSPDLFSLQGLRNLGPTLAQWRRQWAERLTKNPAADLELPRGSMQPIGYVVQQHSVRLDRPVKAYERWIERIPGVYRTAVLGEGDPGELSVDEDPHCLAQLKHYRSLMPLAQEARKPMFHLKSADGALGAHTYAVRSAHEDFAALAQRILKESGRQLAEA